MGIYIGESCLIARQRRGGSSAMLIRRIRRHDGWKIALD